VLNFQILGEETPAGIWLNTCIAAATFLSDWSRPLCCHASTTATPTPSSSTSRRRRSLAPLQRLEESPARGGETRARHETTRPCRPNSRPSGVTLDSCRATNHRVEIVFPRAQGPDWSGTGLGLHHQPAHASHQYSITLFTARLGDLFQPRTERVFSVAAPCLATQIN